jgi:hypothetical protein
MQNDTSEGVSVIHTHPIKNQGLRSQGRRGTSEI